mgnify:CR=1 FL=1
MRAERRERESYTVLMSPNMDETAVHGYSGYLHCSYLGEAGCAQACRLWLNRGAESKFRSKEITQVECVRL